MTFDDFGQPQGMQLDPMNRWVRRADEIPWEELEEQYARLFPARAGNVAKPVRLVLGALIIQAQYGWSDEETAAMIRENPYMQYFCGYRGYDDSRAPFTPAAMGLFRKRLSADCMRGAIQYLDDAKRRGGRPPRHTSL